LKQINNEKWKPQKSCLPWSYSQLNPMTGVAGVEQIEDSTLDRTVSPASKAFNESRLRRVHRLMSLTISVVDQYQLSCCAEL